MTNLDKLREILKNIPDIPQCNLTKDTEFRVDLGLDSVDLAELIVAMEQAYEIEIHEDEFEEIQTVRELMAYVEQKRGILLEA